MIEDLLDYRRVFNTGNYLHGLTTKQTLIYSCFNDRSGSILLKNSGPPADASESQNCWPGEAPQIVFRGIKVQSNALSAALVIGKTA